MKIKDIITIIKYIYIIILHYEKNTKYEDR